MKEIGPRELKLKQQREERFARNQKPTPFEDAARGRDPEPKSSSGSGSNAVGATGGVQRRKGLHNPGERPSSPKGSVPSLKANTSEPLGANPKRGRPKKGEKRDKPWLTCEPPMSKASWYRRQKEKGEK